MSRLSTAAKGREILKSKEKYPPFNLMDYDASLRANLHYYNLEVDDNKKKRDWAIAFWKSQGKDVSGFNKFNDGYFSTVGAVAHMIHVRGISLSDLHMAYMDKKYTDFKNALLSTNDTPSPTQSGQNNKEILLKNMEKEYIGEFQHGIDLFFAGKTFDAKSFLIEREVKGPTAKRIGDALKPTLKEVKEAIAGKDADLVEAYSHLSKVKLRKFADYIQSLIDSCEVAAAITKAARKPRATKVKAPVELVKNVKWLKEDTTSGIKSEHPAKIVNSTEAWVYNAKNRRLFRYVALDGMKLSVKGTTIINVNVEKSGGKIIRKPEILLKNIQSLTSRPMNKLYNDIRGTESRATGRLNEDIAIVKTF